MIDSQDPNSLCDCDQLDDETLRSGCKNFRTLAWDNPTISYEELTSCPEELLSTPCWAENGDGYPDSPPDKCMVRDLSSDSDGDVVEP